MPQYHLRDRAMAALHGVIAGPATWVGAPSRPGYASSELAREAPI